MLSQQIRFEKQLRSTITEKELPMPTVPAQALHRGELVERSRMQVPK